ncbi:glycosyltransferase family 1 protein, partial [Escherichia coli]|nr:glycosyltransferase family 1 protein [Escherichia coli]
HKRIRVIFQNPDDRELLVSAGILKVSNSCLIRGSGVDLREYPYLPEKVHGKTVVMASRLLRDKGVYEFIEAARLLKQRNVEADIRIIGFE